MYIYIYVYILCICVYIYIHSGRKSITWGVGETIKGPSKRLEPVPLSLLSLELSDTKVCEP